MTAVVSGATVMPMPAPSTAMPGKNVLQYEPPTEGSASSAHPTAETSAPATSKGRGPTLPASAPSDRLMAEMSRAIGRRAAPARVGE